MFYSMKMKAPFKAAEIAEMSEVDRRETYEMLRAAHTLLRMAYGCIALFIGIKDEKSAKEFNDNFNFVFTRIASTAEAFIKEPSGDKPAN